MFVNLWTYSARRIASLVPAILIILFINFFVFSLIGHPNPVSSSFPAYSNTIPSFTKAYFTFVWNILSGNWGYLGTIKGQQTYTGPLTELISIYFFATLEVLIIAAPMAIGISFPLGRYLGTHQSYKTAKITRVFVVLGYLTPAYVIALVLLISFGKGVIQGNPLGVFPVQGAFNLDVLFNPLAPPTWLISNGLVIPKPTHMLLFDSIIHDNLPLAASAARHLVLPVLTLLISITAIITFSLESGYVDNMGMQYVKGARSRGLSEREVILKHVRKNAVLPVMASTTIMVAFILSNVIMMEYVFSYPGIGLFLLTTMTHGQYYPTAVIIFLMGLIVASLGVLIDIIYYVKNPLTRF